MQSTDQTCDAECRRTEASSGCGGAEKLIFSFRVIKSNCDEKVSDVVKHTSPYHFHRCEKEKFKNDSFEEFYGFLTCCHERKCFASGKVNVMFEILRQRQAFLLKL